jgi:hypothetical protein
VAHRTFRTAAGVDWQVWNVVPGAWRHTLAVGHERRMSDRRSPDPVLRYTGPERRKGERRKMLSVLSPGLAAGWLTFECAHERRRLSPVPGGWEALTDAALEKLCASATVVPRRIPG